MTDEEENITNRSGGTNLSGGTINIDGDVVGRDKVVGESHTSSINTSGAYVGGNVSVSGSGKFVGRDDYSTTGLTGEEIAQLFETIYQQIDARPNTSPLDKDDLKAEVKDIEAEVAKGDQANESFLERRLRNLKRMAPDILEVVVNSFANPSLGVATVIRKVMTKAQAEAGSA